MKAIKFVAETPNQEETDGYDVNLRNDHWLNLGLVDNSSISSARDGRWVAAQPKSKPAAETKGIGRRNYDRRIYR